MGDASAESFEHMLAGLDALLLSGTPFAEKRDVLSFEDRLANLPTRRLPRNGEVAFVANGGADHEDSVGPSASVNALEGLAAPDKQRGVERPTNSRKKAPYEGLSKWMRFCSICRRKATSEQPVADEGCTQETT